MADNMSDDDFQQKLKELGYSDAAMSAAQSPSTESENAALSPTDTADMDKLDQIRLQAAMAKPSPSPAPVQPPMREGAAEERAQSASGAPLNLPELPSKSEQLEAVPSPAEPSTPASKQPNLPQNQLESNPELNDEALKNAQQKAGLGQLVANLGNAGSTFSANAIGQKGDDEFYNNLGKQARQPVADIEQRRQAFEKNIMVAGNIADVAVKKMNAQEQQELNDPKSAPSQFIKSILANQYSRQKDANGKLVDITQSPGWEDLSGKDALEFQKILASQEHMQALRDQLQFRGQQAEKKQDTHESDKNNADFMKFGKQVQGSIASSRGDFGKNSNVIRQSGQLEQLIKQIRSQPGGADSRQYFELARQLDGMLSSGQGTITGTKELMPHTAQKKFANLEEFVTGTPQAAGLQDFVNRAEDTIKREKQYAVDRNAQTIAKMAPGFSHLKKADTDRWNEILNAQGLDTDEQGNIVGMKTPKELNRLENPTLTQVPNQQFTPDVLDYAKQHNITPDQALSIKQQRTGAQ